MMNDEYFYLIRVKLNQSIQSIKLLSIEALTSLNHISDQRPFMQAHVNLWRLVFSFGHSNLHTIHLQYSDAF